MMIDESAKRRMVQKLATRLNKDEIVAEEWLKEVLQVLNEAEAERAPALEPLTRESREALADVEPRVSNFPYRVGRESRIGLDDSGDYLAERRKNLFPPTNDLYIVDRSESKNVSREHFLIREAGPEEYEIVDRGSECGTMVGGNLIGGEYNGGRCRLENGDIITVGGPSSPFQFRFVLN